MQSDLTVVGGGAIGLICAWRMAQAGMRVTLLDRTQMGREGSWAAAGILAPYGEAHLHPSAATASNRDVMLQACLSSLQLYPALAAELLDASGIDIELSITGTPSPDWREPGLLLIPPDDAGDAAPELDGVQLRPWNGGHAWWLGTEGQVENRKLVEALRRAALNAGVVFREACLIRRISVENDRVSSLVTDSGEVLETDQVLLCAGAWSSKLAGLPFEIPVRPVAGQMVVLRAERRVPHLVYSQGCYLVPRRDGRLLVGATVEETGYTKRVTAGGVSSLLKGACDLMPNLAEAPLESHWAGLRPVSRDGLPILGRTPLANLTVATGHGRNGILLTPWTGEVMRDFLTRGQDPLAEFRLERFPPAKAPD